MILDSHLEQSTSWNRNSGPGIGDKVPTAYDWNTVVEFNVAGGPYSSWLSSNHRPVMANTGKLSLSFELMTDAAALTVAQALEFDTRLVIGKMDYNFGSQFNYQQGGVWQVWREQRWVSTDFKPGKFPSWTWLPIRFDYSFDTVTRHYSYLAAQVGSQSYAVPSQFQGLLATPLNWTDACSMQVQQDLAHAGGSFTIYLRRISYQWS